MTALVERPVFTPAREHPNGEPFYSPLGLFAFQADGTAHSYARLGDDGDDGVLIVYDTGIGKTIMFCALAAFMLNDGETDQAIVVCERNKLRDWRDAMERFTNLSAVIYHGTGRQRRVERFRERNGHLPHVLVTTYETGARELRHEERVPGHRSKVVSDGPLVATLGLRERRSLWGFDEITKLMNRGSQTYGAYEYILGSLRKTGMKPRLMGYTATPLSNNYEQSFNIGRIVCPGRMPTVRVFEKHFCDGRDKYGNLYFDRRKQDEFVGLFQGLLLRKRKTDPDVVEQFPDTVEKSIKVEMEKKHKEFYRLVSGLFEPEPGENDTRNDYQIEADEQKLKTLLRMTAGHAASHIHASNDVSRLIVENVGEERLREIGGSKVDPLLTYLKPICKGQGDQVVIFTYYKTVLYELQRELQQANYSVATYHGSNSDKKNADAEDAFRRGDVEILLCTDAAAKGLNLQAGSYCFEYESAQTYMNRTQRLNRIHRIDSEKSLVTFYTMLLEGTIEDDIINRVMKLNEKQDALVGDEEDDTAFVSADMRRERLGLNQE